MSVHNRTDLPPEGVGVEPEQNISGVDEVVARSTEALASSTLSRRNFLAILGRFVLGMVGAELVRILPVDREVRIAEAAAPDCSAWYMCGMAAQNVCTCSCGSNTCPSQANCATSSKNYWLACCTNGTYYYEVRYIDCCTEGCKPDCCYNSNCQCYNDSPDNWCYPWSLSTLCCTRYAIYPGC